MFPQEIIESNKRVGQEDLELANRKSCRSEEEVQHYKEQQNLLDEENANLHSQIEKLTEMNNNLHDKIREWQSQERDDKHREENYNSEVITDRLTNNLSPAKLSARIDLLK